MAAFNWIEILGRCPVCGRVERFRCQTHVASNYDGDETGRFHDRTYLLGEAMAWWPRDSAKFHEWRVDGRLNDPCEPDWDEEACHATCGGCGVALFAVIRFHENVPERVVAIGPVESWPPGYAR